MPPRIHSMTNAQTKRVREKVLALTRNWMLDRGASDGWYGGAAAFADLGLDRYVGIVEFAYTKADKRRVEGEVVWRLDAAFVVRGRPEVRLANRTNAGKVEPRRVPKIRGPHPAREDV